MCGASCLQVDLVSLTQSQRACCLSLAFYPSIYGSISSSLDRFQSISSAPDCSCCSGLGRFSSSVKSQKMQTCVLPR